MYSKIVPDARRFARRWYVAVTAVAGLAAALVVGVATAANALPNPGFENTCPGASCGWTPVSPATVATDTSTFHSGASLRVSMPAQGAAGGVSTCVALSPGPHSASYWYLRPDTNVISFGMEFYYYSQAGCSSGFITSAKMFGTTVGAWTESTDTVTVPPGTASARIYLVYSCAAVAPASCTANFDDVSLDDATLPVRVVSFSASAAKAGVRLGWHTGTEVDTLGFHVYREHAGRLVRLDRRLIQAKGSVSGARYSFLDRRAPRRKVTYRLQGIGTDGSRTWYGRARAVVR